MGNTKNAYGKPVYDDIYSFPQDSQDAADFADEFANVRALTGVARQALAPGRQRPGMLVTEEDAEALYRTDGAGGWDLLATADGAVFATAGGSLAVSAGAGSNIVFPTGRFTVPPLIFVTPVNNGSVVVPHVTALTKDGFNLRMFLLTNATAASSSANWFAVQKTASAAAG